MILAAFGCNESFGGDKGLPKFEKDLEKFLDEIDVVQVRRRENPPKLVLLTADRLRGPDRPQHSRRQAQQRTDREIRGRNEEGRRRERTSCASTSSAPRRRLYAKANAGGKFLTINGCHLSDEGYQGPRPGPG